MEQTTIRLQKEIAKRADALIAYLQRDPTIAATGRKVSRSTVIRLALLKGLDALESEKRKRKS